MPHHNGRRYGGKGGGQRSNPNYGSWSFSNGGHPGGDNSSTSAIAASTSTTTTTTDNDDWGCFGGPEREPYVYSPAWAKEMPQLLLNPPKHCIDPREMWKLAWGHSDDEDEEIFTGGSTAVNKKMPSALLTARRPSFPDIKPIRLAVGELSNPLLDRSSWSSKEIEKCAPSSESEKKLASAVRQLAGEEEPEGAEKVEIPYSVDLNNYRAKFSKWGGIDYKSFIPPLPSQEDIDKVKEESGVGAGSTATESESLALEEKESVVEVEAVKGEEKSEESQEVEVEIEVELTDICMNPAPDQPLSSVENKDLQEAEAKDTAGQSTTPPPVTVAKMDENCPPLDLKVPSLARFMGFVEGGYTLIRFCDNKTKAQFKNLLETIWGFFGSRSEEELVFPTNQIVEGALVFGKFANQLCRTRVLKNYPDINSALCKDLDTWVLATLPYSDIFYMPPSFMETPFLMHRCRLKNLEFWCSGRVLTELAPLLPTMAEDVYITNYETDEDGIPLLEIEVQLASGGSGGGRNRAMGLSPAAEGKIMLSDLVARTITGFTRVPRQFVKGTLVDRGHVSNVDNDGQAWITIHSAISSRLVAIGENPKRIMTSEQFNRSLGTANEMSDFEYAYFKLGETKFLAHFLDDRGHFRVEVVKYQRGAKEIKVYYMDFGNTEVIPVEDVYPTALFDPLLNKIAPQIFKGQLNGITAVRDVDEFFECVSIKRQQKITVSGFQYPAATVLLDVHILADSTDAGAAGGPEWIYANQFVVDKGIATPKPQGVIPFRRVGGEETNTKTILQLKELSLTDSTAKKRSDCLKAAERSRYITSCRIEQEGDGQYAYLTKIKERSKPLARSPDLDPTVETEEREEEE